SGPAVAALTPAVPGSRPAVACPYPLSTPPLPVTPPPVGPPPAVPVSLLGPCLGTGASRLRRPRDHLTPRLRRVHAITLLGDLLTLPGGLTPLRGLGTTLPPRTGRLRAVPALAPHPPPLRR